MNVYLEMLFISSFMKCAQNLLLPYQEWGPQWVFLCIMVFLRIAIKLANGENSGYCNEVCSFGRHHRTYIKTVNS